VLAEEESIQESIRDRKRLFNN